MQSAHEPQSPASPVAPTDGAAGGLAWAFVGAASLSALAHFLVVPMLHGLLRDRGIDRAEDVQSFLAFFAFLVGGAALLTGSIRLIFFGEETGPNLVYGLRSAVAGIAPAVVMGGVGTFAHLAPPLVATLYGSAAAASLLVAGGLALRRPATRGLGLTVLAVAVAALLRLAAQKAAVVSGIRALQSLYTVAVVLAAGATLFFATAVVLAVLTQRRGARPPGTAEGGEETASTGAGARPPGTAEGGEETASTGAGALWKSAILHGSIASGLAIAWAGLRGLGDHAAPPLVGLAIGLDGALVGPHAGALLVLGRLMAPLGISVGTAFVALGRRPDRIALAAVLLSGARLDAPLGALLALIAAFATFSASDAPKADDAPAAKVDWNAMLAKRGAGPTE